MSLQFLFTFKKKENWYEKIKVKAYSSKAERENYNFPFHLYMLSRMRRCQISIVVCTFGKRKL